MWHWGREIGRISHPFGLDCAGTVPLEHSLLVSMIQMQKQRLQNDNLYYTGLSTHSNVQHGQLETAYTRSLSDTIITKQQIIR